MSFVSGHALLNRAACNSPNTPGPSGQPVLAFPSNPFRPLNFRRAPGFAVTGRPGQMGSDVLIRPRSSSAHTAFQRSVSKEAIPLAQLTVSGEHSTQDDDQIPPTQVQNMVSCADNIGMCCRRSSVNTSSTLVAL